MVAQWIKNLPANAGDKGSIPGLQRFHTPHGNQAHVPQLLSPCAATTEAQAPGDCSAAAEAITMRRPRTAIRE